MRSTPLARKTAEWMKAIEHRNKHKWPFDLGRSVLLVIDMQRYFLEEGSHGFCAGGVSAIPNVQKLISHFRKHERPVIFTRHAHKKNGSDLGILGKWWDEMPVDGTKEAEIDPRITHPPLDPLPSRGCFRSGHHVCHPREGGDPEHLIALDSCLRRNDMTSEAPSSRDGKDEIIITKSRYSAFFNTNLDEILKKLGVREVVITGVMTNICCESTARDAFFRDYMVRFVADATGSVKEEMHVATLLNLAYAFADVCTTEELLSKN